MDASPRQQLDELLFHEITGTDLPEYVQSERDDGTSWRTIAREVARLSGGRVTPSDVTLIAWYRDTAAA